MYVPHTFDMIVLKFEILHLNKTLFDPSISLEASASLCIRNILVWLAAETSVPVAVSEARRCFCRLTGIIIRRADRHFALKEAMAHD